MYQQISPYAGGESTILMSGGLGGHHRVDDPHVTKIGGSDSVVAASWTMGMGGGRPEISLPPDATSTLFVEGLPANCTRREVSRILSFVEKFAFVSPLFSPSSVFH